MSGKLDVIEELVDVNVVTEGGRRGNVSPKTNFKSGLNLIKYPQYPIIYKLN